MERVAFAKAENRELSEDSGLLCSFLPRWPGSGDAPSLWRVGESTEVAIVEPTEYRLDDDDEVVEGEGGSAVDIFDMFRSDRTVEFTVAPGLKN